MWRSSRGNRNLLLECRESDALRAPLGTAAVCLPALLPAPAFLSLVLPHYPERLSKAFLKSQGTTSSPCPQVSVLSVFFCSFVYILFYFLSLSNFVLNRKWSDLDPFFFFELREPWLTHSPALSLFLEPSQPSCSGLWWGRLGRLRFRSWLYYFLHVGLWKVTKPLVEWNNNSACLVGLSGFNIGGFLERVLGTQYDVNISWQW